MEKNKVIMTMICIVLVVFVIAFTTHVLITDTKKYKEEKEIVDITNTKKEEVPVTSTSNEIKMNVIELKNQVETINFDNHISITFTGIKTNNNVYKYTGQVILDGKVINTNVYEQGLEFISFRIYKINNIYVLIANNGAQINGNYDVIMNNTGKILLTNYNVSSYIDEEKITYNYSIAKDAFDETKDTVYKFDVDNIIKG
jgi:hypothetical protein